MIKYLNSEMRSGPWAEPMGFSPPPKNSPSKTFAKKFSNPGMVEGWEDPTPGGEHRKAV
jgi:hypothetical protein